MGGKPKATAKSRPGSVLRNPATCSRLMIPYSDDRTRSLALPPKTSLAVWERIEKNNNNTPVQSTVAGFSDGLEQLSRKHSAPNRGGHYVLWKLHHAFHKNLIPCACGHAGAFENEFMVCPATARRTSRPGSYGVCEFTLRICGLLGTNWTKAHEQIEVHNL